MNRTQYDEIVSALRNADLAVRQYSGYPTYEFRERRLDEIADARRALKALFDESTTHTNPRRNEP